MLSKYKAHFPHSAHTHIVARMHTNRVCVAPSSPHPPSTRQVKVKMVTADDEKTTDITIEGDREEIDRFRRVRGCGGVLGRGPWSLGKGGVCFCV